MSTLIPHFVATLLSIAVCAAQPTIGAIDFFDYSGVDIGALRTDLTVRPGDIWTSETEQLLRSQIEVSLGRSPSDVSAVCCDDDGSRLVYIGLGAGSASLLQLNPPPTESRELDHDFLILYDRFEEVSIQVVSRGDGLALEDQSRGYPLPKDPDVRALQQRIREYASSNSAQLFAVSRASSNARHRAIAIDAIGYGLHSADQIEALTHSALDPDRTARNNAIRALWVLASSQVELQAPIPHDTFVDLLKSGVRTDRGKSTALLARLTESRDPEVLAAILQNSLAPLVECARWSWRGHAYHARVILGRIAGIDEATVLAQAWDLEFVDVALDTIQRSRPR